MSEELRPCPFCGVNEWQYHAHFSGASVFQCEKCGTIVDECVLNTRPIEDALNARIVELKAFIDQLIEAGNALDVPPDDFSEEQKDWREIVKEWKESKK